MTNRDQLEFNIIEFIKNNLTFDIFVELRYYYELYDYTNLHFYDNLDYKEFISHNNYCIKHLDYSKLLFISLLIDNIEDDFLFIANKKYIEKKINYGYFNHDNQFIIKYY